MFPLYPIFPSSRAANSLAEATAANTIKASLNITKTPDNSIFSFEAEVCLGSFGVLLVLIAIVLVFVIFRLRRKNQILRRMIEHYDNDRQELFQDAKEGDNIVLLNNQNNGRSHIVNELIDNMFPLINPPMLTRNVTHLRQIHKGQREFLKQYQNNVEEQFRATN